MNKLLLMASVLAVFTPLTAWAQDTASNNLPTDVARAPDGTRA